MSVARLLPLVAAGLLAGGFADLALGGTTLAAVLLVTGYCVGVPAAIVRGRLSRRQCSRAQLLPR